MNQTGEISVAFRGKQGSFALDAAFTAPGTGITALFGPSGCGKTTVLRCIAGLQQMADGFCRVNGEVWQDAATFRPTHRRALGYVFQEASLFPHLSVRRNLLYGAPVAGNRNLGLDTIVELLGLTRLVDRAPHALSGGERQRVAIGRALLSQPGLLLMDEPLAALDRATKDEILPFLERLHGALSVPIVYVSHDMSEVERLADHLVLMQAGHVLASGPLRALQADPALPLMRARDAAASVDAVAESYDASYGMMAFAVAGGRFLVPSPQLAPGLVQRLRINAGDVSLSRSLPHDSTITNVLPARILSATATSGHEITAVLGLGDNGTGARMLARITRRSWEMLALGEGQSVFAQVKAVALAPAANPLPTA